MNYNDHFSGHAETYMAARPDYPESLFTYLGSLCPAHDLAWDCACGNGQAAGALTRYFKRVVASDGSAEQLAQAPVNQKIQYHQALAEQAFIAPGTVDLVVVAQALHWFNLPLFFNNARQALKPSGVIAAWCYGLHRIDDPIDAIVEHFYDDIVGVYWPLERSHVEAAYSDIEFPFDEIEPPGFTMTKSWTFDQLIAFLESWSAVQRYMKANGKNPLHLVADEIRKAWGDVSRREVSWQLTLRVGSR